jgi:D-glycero-alpha-D-manno-heptose-7-phosphate kinase
VPPGSGLGTSASVVVALIGALRLLAGETLDRSAIARAAHETETVGLGLQSGLGDQLAAAHGGANVITIDPYPVARIAPVTVAPGTWEALTRRLVTVYLGRPHHSSTVHETVIARLRTTEAEVFLAPLRTAATAAARALAAGDIEAYGEAMTANTEAQAELHGPLVSAAAWRVAAIADRHHAAGWKVNGAGGDGGTVSVIGPDDPRPLISDLRSAGALTVLPVVPARRGLRLIERA